MKMVSQSTWHKKIVYLKQYESPELLKMLEEIDLYFSSEQHDAKSLKQGDTTTVMLVEKPDAHWIIKKYNLVNWWGRLKRALTVSRAARCWRFSFLLKQLDVKIPKHIAYIEKKWGPFRQEAYFICEYIPGVNALAYFSDIEQHPEEEVERYARDILMQIKKMHQSGVTHGDMKATNIILNEQGAFFIDFDGMRRYDRAALFQRAREKDLVRFRKNWKEIPKAQTLFSSMVRDYIAGGW